MGNVGDWLVPIVIALLGGGGIWALFKIRPEAGMVVVQAAESVVIMQKGTIEELSKKVEMCQAKADEACSSVERLEGELYKQRLELDNTRKERDAVARENETLKAEVRRLEDRVAELERNTPANGTGEVPAVKHKRPPKGT